MKFLIGLFDHPYQEDLAAADAEVNSLENQAVALQASRESLVLLKNKGKLLPLDVKQIKNIAVSGPNADDVSYALTHYGPLAVDVVSVLEGIKNKVGNEVNVFYSKGCDIVDEHWPDSEIIEYPLTEDEQNEIDKAVADAKKSDIAIVVLGENSRTAGENRSRTSLDLPGRQLQLLKAIYETGKPVILILINGRPLSINWADRNIPAIIEAWYPGSQGGTAIADVLFGDYNPGGKLTVTFPKTVGQIPFNFPAKPFSQVDAGKVMGLKGDMAGINGALYPFGYGLSYTSFEYSDLTLSSKAITDKENLTVSCKVKNVGKYAGDEILQLYVRDLVSSVTTYEKNLVGFERIHLLPGEEKEVIFVIQPRDLQLYNIDEEWVVEPGDFRVMVGASSEDIRLKDIFTVVENEKTTSKNVEKSEELRVVSTPFSSTAKNVLDNDLSTYWEGKKNDCLTFPINSQQAIDHIDIVWHEGTDMNSTFEIQLSSGGGQFLTVYKGKPSRINVPEKYTFKESMATDLRIIVDSGVLKIAEVYINR